MRRLEYNWPRLAVDKKLRNDERAQIVGWFTDKINEERLGTKYKPLSPAYIATRVSHVNTDDLRSFYYSAEKAENFSKYFFGCLRVK
jgi:hypothetical protein